MRAALDQRDPNPEPAKELRQFHRDRSSAQDNQRLRQSRQGQRIIAGQESSLGQLRHRRRRDPRTGADDKVLCRQTLWCAARNPVQAQSVRVQETGARPQQLEFSVVQLVAAISGKILHHGMLAGHDRVEIEARLWNPEAPGTGGARQMQDLCRVEQRLARHASPQNAKAAQRARPFHQHSVQTRRRCGVRRGKSRAAAAHHGNVIRERIAHPALHSSNSSCIGRYTPPPILPLTEVKAGRRAALR